LLRMMLFFGSGSIGRKYGVCIASLSSACFDRMVKKLSRTLNTLFSGPFFTYEQDISTD